MYCSRVHRMTAFRHRPLVTLIFTVLSFLAVEAVVFVTPDRVNEENGILAISVLNSLFVQDWNFTYATVPVTAMAGEDFIGTTPAHTVTVLGGNLIHSIIIPIINDNRNEFDETFILRVQSFSTGDPDRNVTITIIDDEGPPISLSHPGNITVTEGTDNVTLNMSRADFSTDAFNVTVNTLDITATAHTDYSPLEGTVFQFGDGELSKLATIYIIDDSVMETLEMFTVVVHGLALLDNVTVTVTIEDNDVTQPLDPPISLSHPGNITVTEGTDNVTLNMSRADFSTDAFNVTVNTLDITATAHTDYSPLESTVVQFGDGELSKLATIYIIDDSVMETLEMFTVVVHGLALLNNVTATVTIEDNDVTQPLDPPISLSHPGNITVTEGTDNVTLNMSRADFSTDAFNVTVNTLDITATAHTDYSPLESTVVQFGEGELSKLATIYIIDDSVMETLEMFTVVVHGLALLDNVTVTVTIEDNDVTQPLDPPISLSHPGNITVTEGTDNVTLNMSRADFSTDAFNVTVNTLDITATAHTDYSPLESTVVQFGDGELSKLATIYIIDDSVMETLEMFTVVVHGLALLDNVTVTVTIEDNDVTQPLDPPISLSHPGNITVTEGTDNVTLNMSRADFSTDAFNVTVNTLDITATAHTDYSPLESTVVQFGDGELSKLATIYIIDDSVIETVETFTVVVHGPALLDNITVTVSIRDNDITQSSTHSAPVGFHCGRGDSQPCLNNGVCNYEDGTCDCSSSPGFEGVNCGIETSNISTSCGCENGTCMNTGTADVCVCHPRAAGGLCDRKAYFHQCAPNGFSVCMTPFSVATFVGYIYVIGKSSVSECHLAPDPGGDIVDWCRGYTAFIQYNSTCGELGSNVNGEITRYVLRLRVQYTKTQLRSTDEEVIFMCQHDNNGTAVWGNTLRSDPSVRRETAVYLPASLSIHTKNGDSVDGTLNFGDEITICVSVSEEFLEGVWIRSITVNNTRRGSDFRNLLLYEDKCIPDLAAGIFTMPPEWRPDTERHTMCLQMLVFYFAHDVTIDSPALGFLLDIEVFEDQDMVTEISCERRRKRQTGSGKDMILGATVNIRTPYTGYRSELHACPCRDWVTLTTIVLGIVVCSMIVVVVILVTAIIVSELQS